MEATRFYETSVYNKPTRHYIPEDGILRKLDETKMISLSVLYSPPLDVSDGTFCFLKQILQ
jgi:hypothetical protein